MIKTIIGVLLLSGHLYAQNVDLNITDLGFKQDKAQQKPTEIKKMLKEREYYLSQHQIWGLVSAGALALTFLTGEEEELPPIHPFLAGLAVTSYAAAAYTSWKAPEIKSKKLSGGSLWHRRLAWIHLPGMILTPILGYLAAQKIKKGEEPEGIAEYHSTVATVTTAALVLSVFSVSFEF